MYSVELVGFVLFLLSFQWTSRCCRVPSLPFVTPAGLRRTPLSLRKEVVLLNSQHTFVSLRSCSLSHQDIFTYLNMFNVNFLQGQSSDPPPEGPEAALPWLWTPHSLDPGPAGKKTFGWANGLIQFKSWVIHWMLFIDIGPLCSDEQPIQTAPVPECGLQVGSL